MALRPSGTAAALLWWCESVPDPGGARAYPHRSQAGKWAEDESGLAGPTGARGQAQCGSRYCQAPQRFLTSYSPPHQGALVKNITPTEELPGGVHVPVLQAGPGTISLWWGGAGRVRKPVFRDSRWSQTLCPLERPLLHPPGKALFQQLFSAKTPGLSWPPRVGEGALGQALGTHCCMQGP